MSEINWMHTGETENGLQIWINQIDIDGEKYLQMQYKTKDGQRIGEMQTIAFKRIKLLNSLVGCAEMEWGV